MASVVDFLPLMAIIWALPDLLTTRPRKLTVIEMRCQITRSRAHVGQDDFAQAYAQLRCGYPEPV